MIERLIFIPGITLAVSYTHLDVYKRQVPHSARYPPLEASLQRWRSPANNLLCCCHLLHTNNVCLVASSAGPGQYRDSDDSAFQVSSGKIEITHVKSKTGSGNSRAPMLPQRPRLHLLDEPSCPSTSLFLLPSSLPVLQHLASCLSLIHI